MNTTPKSNMLDCDHPNVENNPPQEQPEVYSVFTRAEKWIIVSIASYAACFSTLSSFIYFPALQPIADGLGVSIEKINLAITCYMAVATVAPMLIGDTADVLGRRPVYILALILYVCSNIGMGSSDSYGAHIGLRVLQAMSISGTISIAYGVVTDISTPGERGTFVIVVSFGSTVAPSLGSILGGTLTYAGGWQWIFWFLAISSGACLLLMVFFLPETSRKVVGNGSIRPPLYFRLPTKGCFGPRKDVSAESARKKEMPNPVRSLKILTRIDNLCIALACGLLYTVYTCANAALSIILIDIYDLNQWQVGLAYLPFGIGGVVSTLFCGQLMDKAYRRARAKAGLSTDLERGDDLDTFAVEKARLNVIWVPMLITVVTVGGFGWTLQARMHLAVPLAVLFCAGLVMNMDFSIYNTLLVDKNHRTPSAAQASSNIIRCTMAAIMTAFLQQLVDTVGPGWTFTLMAGLCAVALSLFVIDYRWGTRWRQNRLSI